MDKRHKEILSTLVDKLRFLLNDSVTYPGFESDKPAHESGEQSAYLWIIRLLVLRTLEARGLSDKKVWMTGNHDDQPEKLSPPDQDKPTTTGNNWWARVLQACTELARVLPGLFTFDRLIEQIDPKANRLLMCLELLSDRQLDAIFADPDAIGWAYQFYQTAARTEINAKCKNGGKVESRAELVAKTQLFTEPYMVQWLLQNSLGRSYAEAYPQNTLSTSWPYFVSSDSTDQPPGRVFPLEELTLLDPCMGSGHFLRSAFDLFATMYREQYPEMSAATIAERILGQHLFGIDLDSRAAQISALTLHLRAWELVKTEQAEDSEPAIYLPPEMHLVHVPAALAHASLQRHLQRYPRDAIYQDQLAHIFAGLEQIHTLGSLLCIREFLDQAINDAHKNDPLPLSDTPEHIHQRLLEQIIASCLAEGNPNDDHGLSLSNHKTGQIASLLHILDKHYAVVATNPPYLDSRDMNQALRQYIAIYYQAGKRDLYAAFLLRCFDLCQPQGRVAVITMQSWMFNRSFAELRAAQEEKVAGESGKRAFTGLLRETCIEALVHLGARSFEGIGGEIVQSVMFTLVKRIPDQEFRIRAWRLVGLRSVEEKHVALLHAKTRAYQHMSSRPRQRGFLLLHESPVVYQLSDHFTLLLATGQKLRRIAHIRQGLATADNARFTRYHWEIASPGEVTHNGEITGRWFRYAKGGSYQKWAGLMWMVVDWEHNGQRIKLGVDAQSKPRFRDNAPQFAFQPGLTYTFIASGSFGTRLLNNALFDVAGTSLFLKTSEISLAGLAAVTSSHVISYLLRMLTQDLKFNAGYVASTPLAPDIPWNFFHSIGTACIHLKKALIQ